MWQGIAAGLGAGALWGLVFVAPRMLDRGGAQGFGFSSIDLTSSRYAVYGLLALTLVLLSRQRQRWPSRRQWGAALGLSLLGNTGYYLLVVLAVADAGSEVPTLIIGTIPLWIMLLGKPGHLSWRLLWPGFALTALGLGLMMASQHATSVNAGRNFWLGVAYALAALLSWTAYALLNTRWMKIHPDVSAIQWSNWLGLATGAGAAMLWLIAGTPVHLIPKTPQAADLLVHLAILSVALGVGASWLATIGWNFASQRLSASLCGQLIVSETLFGLLYSYAWDQRWPSVWQLVACLCFVAGIVWSIRAHR